MAIYQISYDFLEEHLAERFIHTSTGNIISRSASISRPQSLEVPGGKCFIHHDCIVRADLATIQLNRYVYVDRNVILRPSNANLEEFKFIPLSIGTGTFIGENSVIESATIGVGCEIGRNCLLSKRSILKDYVKVLDDTVILPDMVIPPFSIVGGNPGMVIGEQPESVTSIAPRVALDRYKSIILTQS